MDDAGSSPVCQISYKLSRGTVAEGFIGLKIWDFPKIRPRGPTSLGREGSSALVGSQSRRRTIPIRNLRVPGMLDRPDMRSGQWAGPLDLYGKEDAPALHESPRYG